MFTEVEIGNFKCLGLFTRPLGSLTLLTGLNAAGKSSVAQIFALLKQTVVDNEWSRALHLNGSSIQLGTMYDVIDRNVGGSGFHIGLKTPSWSAQWHTTSEDRKRELVAQLQRIRIEWDDATMEWTKEEISNRSIRQLIPDFSRGFVPEHEQMRASLASISFIGAERIGPREVYVAQNPMPYADVGAQGEKTPWCLEQFADDPVNPSLALPGIAETVRLTVQGWMEQLFPGFQLQINRVDAANLVTMGIRTSLRGDFFRPANVGFGLSHVLPIVTGCVAARPGRLVVVENPETHLHPAGQSLIGYFLAVAASGGVQLIVETHSDHVLNGARRAIRDQRLSADKVRIYYFRTALGVNGEPATVVDNVTVEQTGKIKNWPAGFFDQMDADLDYIYRD